MQPEPEPEPEPAAPAPPLGEKPEADDDDDDDDDCPVCLSPGTADQPLLTTACGHRFCRGCIERVLTTTKSLNPTSAPCPVCRTALSLFDLKLPSGTLLHPKDTTCAALAGKVFAQQRTVGLASYHFPAAETEAEGGNAGGEQRAALPYLCYESPSVNEYGWTLDNGAPVPQRKHFEPGCHWHAATRTFHGTVLWEEGWYGSKRWDYVMQFSSEFRYICGGSVSMHRPEDPPHVSPFGPPPQGLSYVQWHVSTEEAGAGSLVEHPPGPVYHAGTLWGNVFVQAMRVGLASYHFVPPAAAAAAAADGGGDEQGDAGDAAEVAAIGSAYISYEHPDCAQWPSLDDGSPVPARVPFTNIQFDATSRTFRGTVPWRATYGTSW
jgi:hypothetical protein